MHCDVLQQDRSIHIPRILGYIPYVYKHRHRLHRDEKLLLQLIIDPTHVECQKWLPLQRDLILELEERTQTMVIITEGSVSRTLNAIMLTHNNLTKFFYFQIPSLLNFFFIQLVLSIQNLYRIAPILGYFVLCAKAPKKGGKNLNKNKNKMNKWICAWI